MATLLLRLAVCALLTWQAVAALASYGPKLRASWHADWGARLTATTDERLRDALGDDAELLFELSAAAEPGSMVFTEQVQGRIEDVQAAPDPQQLLALLARRNGLIDQLVTLTYPNPWLFAAPDPVAAVERHVQNGNPVDLCVLPWQQAPAGRPGWTMWRDGARFELWRFRTE